MNQHSRLLVLAVFFTFLAMPHLFSQQKVQVTQAKRLGITQPLRDKPPILYNANLTSVKAKKKANRPAIPNFTGNTPMPTNHLATALPQGADPVRQSQEKALSLEVLPQFVVEGIEESESQVYPPDPSGYIGSNHYIQTTNGFDGTLFEIFDKEGNSIYGPTSTLSFWEEFNIVGFGDPIVLYDQAYDRWLITEFGPFGNDVFLVAVSATPDPLGSWYAYQFQAPSFPDYPKYNIWPDGYYITSNEGGDPNIPVYVINREQIMAGAATVAIQRIAEVPKFTAFDAFQVASPVDWDGSTPPPADEPGYVVRIYDDAWEGGQDRIELWKIHVDWDNPNASGAIGPISLPVAPFDSKICNSSIFDCLYEPDGSPLSALEQVVMHRAQYRNFGSHESIVLNHVVDVSGDNQAGIRWYELRRLPGGDWQVYQQGTWAPDENDRFMASIAMDIVGNMLMGYSIVGPDKFLSLRYTGRLAGDPLGEMTVTEYEFGTGQSISGTSRWGDYASMTVDPTDHRTFWFTGEYMQAGQWGTKILKAFIQRDSNDIGVNELITPKSSGYLTANEVVKAKIRNYGYKPASGFSASLQFQGAVLETVNIPDTLDADSTMDITFVTTVDLSTIGSYNFRIFTTYANDTTFVNDTLRAVVKQLTRNDAAIIGFLGLDQPICDSSVQAAIIIQNTGVDTLFSATISYWVNNVPFTLDWAGVLPPGGQIPIDISIGNLLDGNNEIVATSSLPNGVPDEDPSNDNQERPFLAVLDGAGMVLEILTDNYPSETTWKIFDNNGNELLSGGPYQTEQTVYTEPLCLPEGCYTFTIYDSFGDGVSWGGVEGSYKILNEDGIVVASIIEPAFGFEESNDFCTEYVCLLDFTANIGFESGPNANDGFIIVAASNGDSPFQYSINGGASFQNSSLFTNLADGIYTVVVRDEVGCLSTKEVVVGTCTLQATATTTPAATSVSEDGTITVEALNGFPPYEYSVAANPFQDSPTFSNVDEGQYTVVVRDSVGCEATLSVTVSATTDASDRVFGYAVKIYPNPTKESFKVEIKGMDGLSEMPVRIFDANGKLVMTDNLVRYNESLVGVVSLKNYPTGVYFMQFNDLGGQSKLMRIIKE